MAQGITVAKFRDVAGGLQEGQFAVGDRVRIKGLSDLDPIYKALLDRPITVTLGLIGPDGRIGLTPMWFDYAGDKVLVNTASHRAKCGWIRKNPKLTILIVNPDNAYHWVQLKCTVEREEREWDPGGERIADLRHRQPHFRAVDQPRAPEPMLDRCGAWLGDWPSTGRA